MAEETNVVHDAAVTTNEQTSTASQLRYSGFWVRWAAHIIDAFIIFLILGCVVVPFLVFLGFTLSLIGASLFVQFLGATAGIIVAWTYYIFMTDRFQATLGKMAVGVKVVDLEGKKLDTGRVALRETLGKILSRITLNVGFLMVAFTNKKQGLHDLVGGSVVVCTDPVKGPNKLVVVTVFLLAGLFVSVFLILFGVFFGIIWLWVMHGVNDGFDSVSQERAAIVEEYDLDENMMEDHLFDILDKTITIDNSSIEQL